MGFLTLLLLAFGLSADAFAVALSNGMCHHRVTKKQAFLTALCFGFFQALMPTLGFFLGRTFSAVVWRYQHWVALFLLGAIGVNMLSDTFKEWNNPEVDINNIKNDFSAGSLTLQGIATSIDALAAGVSIAVLNINILSSVFVIGVVTFFVCLVGVSIGKRFGSLLGIRAKIIGGIVLIATGMKIFVENQFF